MVEKNKDTLNADMIELMQISKNSFISSLFPGIYIYTLNINIIHRRCIR